MLLGGRGVKVWRGGWGVGVGGGGWGVGGGGWGVGSTRVWVVALLPCSWGDNQTTCAPTPTTGQFVSAVAGCPVCSASLAATVVRSGDWMVWLVFQVCQPAHRPFPLLCRRPPVAVCLAARPFAHVSRAVRTPPRVAWWGGAQALWYLPLHILCVISSLRWFQMIATRAHQRPASKQPDVKDVIR